MGQKVDPAQALEVRAGEARTLAEAQALHAEADRLRRVPRAGPLGLWSRQPLFRN
ncbi:MAG: hypothetical protein V4574_15010 [Pseudomonadota bacterium]